MTIESLKNQAAFNQVNKTGIKLYTPYCLIIASRDFHNPNLPKIPEGQSLLSIGMKVSKKMGNAVIRNKIKRRIRHLARIMQKTLLLPSNLALIIIPKKGFDKIEFALIEEALAKTLSSYAKTLSL